MTDSTSGRVVDERPAPLPEAVIDDDGNQDQQPQRRTYEDVAQRARTVNSTQSRSLRVQMTDSTRGRASAARGQPESVQELTDSQWQHDRPERLPVSASLGSASLRASAGWRTRRSATSKD